MCITKHYINVFNLGRSSDSKTLSCLQLLSWSSHLGHKNSFHKKISISSTFKMAAFNIHIYFHVLLCPADLWNVKMFCEIIQVFIKIHDSFLVCFTSLFNNLFCFPVFSSLFKCYFCFCTFIHYYL